MSFSATHVQKCGYHINNLFGYRRNYILLLKWFIHYELALQATVVTYNLQTRMFHRNFIRSYQLYNIVFYCIVCNYNNIIRRKLNIILHICIAIQISQTYYCCTLCSPCFCFQLPVQYPNTKSLRAAQKKSLLQTGFFYVYSYYL